MTTNLDLPAQLEAILFVATEPLPLARLAATTGTSLAKTQAALAKLATSLNGGVRLSEIGGQYRLVTAPLAATLVRQFLQDETKTELSRAALETLAIVAYRGPLTKSAIEAVRGVASDAMLRNLVTRGLIREAGRSDEPGRPQLYAVSHTFLQHFGLTSPADLPPLPGAAHAR
jgi:segregation and condensation protein B